MRFSSVIRGRISPGNKDGDRDKALVKAKLSPKPLRPASEQSLNDETAAAAPQSSAKPIPASQNSSANAAAANNASVVKPMYMSPSGCTVLIVDKRFLKGVYYTAASGSPTMRGGPALDDVVFVQELLEIYGQVVAVLSGDTALRWIFNHTGNKAIIVLIDVDETYDRDKDDNASLFCGPIYTPPSSPQDQQQLHHSGHFCQRDSGVGKDMSESQDSGPYGLALLRVIAHYVAIGVFRNVAPIGKHDGAI
ncbi:hypothetical protein H4217_005916 [Coemansia sp. RSA 1939]|nr:hypothetical protein H4217_005916 [Coemansia sp. RSA 1939]